MTCSLGAESLAGLWLGGLWPCPGRISPLPGCVVAGPGLQKKAKKAKKAINIVNINGKKQKNSQLIDEKGKKIHRMMNNRVVRLAVSL